VSRYLYGASVQGIQEYIFATNELKSIIGASELIGNINKKIDERYKEHIIVNAAGNIKLIFDEKSEFEALVEEFTKEVKQEAFGLTISQAVVAFEEGGLKEAFNTLEKRLMVARNQPEIPLDTSINIMEIAPKTARPLVSSDLDMATSQKEQAYIKDEAHGEVANVKNKKNKIAIIHADGNGLGAMIAAMSKNLTSDEEVQQVFKQFSLDLERATQNAVNRAKEKLPQMKLRQVILGGDDLTVVCDANSALEFSNYFLEAFEEETKAMGGLTACAGIAYCNYKYPFHYAVSLAESLCAEAKKHSRIIDSTLPPSSLMFHNIQSSNFTTFEDYVDNELTLNSGEGKVYLNYGPYFVHETRGYSTIKSFLYLAHALNQKDSPLSRLREWLTILGQDAKAAKSRLERINQMMALKQDTYKKEILERCLKLFNEELDLNVLMIKRDEKYYTPVYDVITHLSVIDLGRKTMKMENDDAV
jgi:CRISPR/Cas system-associated protein Cas10 (large subunit of type III CRISPR-Cas system)